MALAAVEELGMDDADDDAREGLAAVRAAWTWEAQDEMNFYTRILGGAWTQSELGVVADCVSGFARAWVQDWCERYDMASSARFGFARYGRAGAHQLCREWCRRNEYFFRIYQAAENDFFEFAQAHIDDYQEDMEWLDFMIAEPADTVTFARGMEIRRMVPRVGPAIVDEFV